jgi:uncharacterized protein YjbI with pentapeptide repeats
MAGERIPWRESWRFLEARGGALPPPDRWPDDPGELDRPQAGQDRVCPQLRDARQEETDWIDLTLRRTLFDRCRFHGVSFRNSDLQLSCLTDSEFLDCDLTGIVLTCAELRGSTFFACRFINACLIGAELRGATFEHCDFTGADLTGARIDRTLKETLPLSDLQRQRMVDWRSPDDVGPDDNDQDE